MIWVQIKKYLATHNHEKKFNVVKNLCFEAVNKVTPENWAGAVRHCENIEEEYWTKDGLVDDEIPPIIMPLSARDFESDLSDYSESSDDESEI